MALFQIKSIQEWGSFVHEGNDYSLSHLNAHSVTYTSEKAGDIVFVVTYGLHCFTKTGTIHSIPVAISDSKETRHVDLERYKLSKMLRQAIDNFSVDNNRFYKTSPEKFFTLQVNNPITGVSENYKICVLLFKENRLLRMHVTSAFIVKEGLGSPENPVKGSGFSIFKIALDLKSTPKGKMPQIPKEANNNDWKK